MNHPLTEDRVLDIAVRYLRSHYKFWPRTTDIEVQLRLRAEGAVVVDGLLSFQKPDHTVFTIAVEATDYMHREEVWFRKLWELTYWDAGATASLTGSLIFLMLHIQHGLKGMHSHPWIFAVLVLCGAAGLTVIVYYLLRSSRRYRYVYAVEQFKQYQASNQWIVFSWDVFPGYADPYFLELKAQCVYHGFGMLEVAPDESVKLHITPAREGLPARKKRRIVQFFTEREWTQRVQARVGALNWRDSLSLLVGKLTQRQAINDLVRFKQPVWRQLGVCVVATTLCIIVLFREYGQRPVIYVDEQEYVAQLEAKALALQGGEAAAHIPVLYDTAAVWPFSKGQSPYLQITPDTTSPWSSMEKSGFLRLGKNQFAVYPCAVAYETLSGRYAITLGIFYDLDFAKSTLLRLRALRIPVNVLMMGCFDLRRGYYVLVTEQIFSGMEEAERTVEAIKLQLEYHGVQVEARIEYFD